MFFVVDLGLLHHLQLILPKYGRKNHDNRNPIAHLSLPGKVRKGQSVYGTKPLLSRMSSNKQAA